ncbi:MAG TPA: hypothetical protein VMW24_22300, partial [Sedimentisphaerales bacterium]|nr:hypothetical protein [Sedimentisphaerales bacterium]
MSKSHSILRWYVIGVVLSLAWGGQAGAVNLHVCIEGRDGWSGTLAQPNAGRTDGPLATLTGARDAIRRLKSRGPLAEPVRVIVADGTYALAGPLVLTHLDSGTQACPISYEAASGAKPVFTGGRSITRFRQGPDGLWEARLPEVASGEWYFEQLFVNGRRAVRARTPNEFYYYMSDIAEQILEKGRSRTATQARQTVRARPEDIAPLLAL